MLTPIEIQGITFKTGRGYKKEDVDSFMKALHHDYEIMYKENMELKEKITTLSDGIQYYKNLEKTLQKALVLAEKTSEETKEAATKNAQAIENQAKLNAEKILYNARQEYDRIEVKTQELLQNFELYKAQFQQIVNTQQNLLQSSVFQIQLREFNFEEEEKTEAVKPVIDKAVNIDKVEVQASDEEELQTEMLAQQVNEEGKTQSAAERKEEQQESEPVSIDELADVDNSNVEKLAEESAKLDEISAAVLEEEEKLMTAEPVTEQSEEEELETSEDEYDALEEIEEKLSEENRKVTEQREKKSDKEDETDLEIKMLQKLLNEIKKNSEPDTSDEEFEFINTDSDE